MASISSTDDRIVAAILVSGMIAAAAPTAFGVTEAVRQYFDCIAALETERTKRKTKRT